jgi:hypothetical protein
VAVVASAISYWGAGRMYRGIGGGALGLGRDTPAERAPTTMGTSAPAEAREEIRQLLQAKSDRRESRGEPPLDVEAELSALTAGAPAHDPALRDEVLQLVVARNERRVRQGREPLDVEAEVERQLRSLGG